MRKATGLLLLATLLGAACSRTTVSAPPPGASTTGMVVSGTGRVEAQPDTLAVSLGVSSQERTAAEVLQRVNRRASAMLRAVKAEGIPARDIRTTGLSVRPRFGTTKSTRSRIVAFVGAETFSVKIRTLDRAGDVVEAAVKAAGDDARVSGMALEIADPEGAKQDARRKAVEDARRRAQELATAAGVRLGAPISIEEAEVSGPHAFPVTFGDEFVTAGPPGLAAGRGVAGGGSAATAVAGSIAQIEAGTQEIVVRVQVRFRIFR